MRQGVFLDRDGTINKEVGYLYDPQRLVLIPGASKAIKRLNDEEWLVVCISNQSGVARGYFTLEAVYEVNKKLEVLLATDAAYLDRIYFCPHHPTCGNPPYNKNCRCRKPATEMIDRAACELNIDLKCSYLIGDSLSDIQAAQNSGLKSILVLTGYGHKTLSHIKKENLRSPDYICQDISDGVELIINEKHNNKS